MTAAVPDLARSSSATTVLLVSDAGRSAVNGGRVVIRPDGYIGLIAGAAEDVSGYFAQLTDDSLPSFPLGAKAHRGIIHIEGEAP